MNAATTAAGPRQSPKATLVMACLGVFVAYLPVTSVSVSLPAIQRALHASTSQLSWISDAFVLPMAALIPTAGVFGDVHGRKKVFQTGLLFAAAGAAVALCAQSVQVLWVGQALAGLGAAALLPTTLALISHVVRDPHERAKFVLQRTPRVTSVSAHCLLHHFYGGPLGWLSKINALSPEEQAALSPPPVEPAAAPVLLDDADEALLALLSRDGRTPLTELQASTDLPESAVRRRLDRLRSTGVLYLDVQFDHESLGHDVVAMLWLRVAPATLADVGHALAAHPEVRFAAAVTGQANIVAATLHANTGDLYTYLSDKIGALDGVRSVETALTTREVKQLTYEPGR